LWVFQLSNASPLKSGDPPTRLAPQHSELSTLHKEAALPPFLYLAEDEVFAVGDRHSKKTSVYSRGNEEEVK
jgi:hypothetical protein